jgi:hypothetical protein
MGMLMIVRVGVYTVGASGRAVSFAAERKREGKWRLTSTGRSIRLVMLAAPLAVASGTSLCF